MKERLPAPAPDGSRLASATLRFSAAGVAAGATSAPGTVTRTRGQATALPGAGSASPLPTTPAAAAGGRGWLPAAPDDVERDSYFGPQRRWITAVSFAGYVLIAISVSFFLMRHVWALALLFPLGISALGTTVSLVTSTRRRRSTLAEHMERVVAWQPPAGPPSLDVFLPSAGEDLSVLRNTYRHVARLEWAGRVTVHVLDDSARPPVRELAEQHGFRYHSRPDRGHLKKAGNLRYGFEHSDGDLIAIFDADFVPRSDFARHLVPYFDDPEIGLVQSPQYFDAEPEMNWIQRAAGATQVLFYKWVQPSRDRSNAAICVGTSAIYRRSALVEAGGFAQIGHSEDVHTGVKLMTSGYTVRYVPIVVSKGICPDNLDHFTTQQYRWCTGSMSLLFSRSFHRAPLTFMQRLCYWSGYLYYISTAFNVFTAALPSILMALFVASRVRPSNYVLIVLALVARIAVVPIITLERESFVGLARIQTTYSFAHALALFDVVRRRTDSWVATGSAVRSGTAVRVRRLARVWLTLTQLLLWGGLAWRIPEYGFGRYWVMLLFALLNLYVIGPIAFGPTEPGPALPRRMSALAARRRAARADIDLR